jgi:hypothetical protein
MRKIACSTLVIVFLAAIVARVEAQQPAPEQDTTGLVKKTQNPVGDVVTLPFQFNFNTGGDLGDATFFNLNFQPVFPFKLTSDWSMIVRTIVPIDSVPATRGEPKTDLFVLQPFVNYNFGQGWTVAFAPIITANWDASDGNEWTVPIGLGMTPHHGVQRPPDESRRAVLLQRCPGRTGPPAISCGSSQR